MATDKKRFEKFLTPVGVAQYPRLSEADFKFKKETGEFGVKVILPAADADVQAIIARAQAARDEEFAFQQNKVGPDLKFAQSIKKVGGLRSIEVFDEEMDEATGTATGNVILKISMPHRITVNKGKADAKLIELWPAIFDSANKPVKSLKIGGGSQVRVAGHIRPYFVQATGAVGASFRLEAVQVVKLVEFGQRDAKGYGFAASADGFTSETPAGIETAATGTAPDVAGESPDF